ncbi:alpha/beta hydrolase [Bradyrhizobium sp. CB2312]|uniref:alpha/beta hydrolase n=1 Tax=Bradyrhizobium sp. CB2312 TaxID=3039155 RepID=UPI0024B22100|nr:alpha/beta hydrolase [Bradyrhizobium sp. CB2312]WFU68644.1 alpha/beta hydrolase [Bradyrhizobium sp. CB2312]
MSTGRIVAEAAQVTLENFLVSRFRTVILVHGYNVSEKEALKSLGELKVALSSYAPSLASGIFTCRWAGNWITPIVRLLAYPQIIGNAEESSKPFLRIIKNIYCLDTATEELIIIAHSLGCRLTLEMLQHMAAEGRPQGLKKLTVILMAAAVPCEYVGADGKLEAGADEPDVLAALHSKDDRVLSFAFGAGQTLGFDGLFPEAIGLRGNPQSRPWTHSIRMDAFDHGDYWSEETAQRICRILGIVISPFANTSVPLASRKQLGSHRDLAVPPLPMFWIGNNG